MPRSIGYLLRTSQQAYGSFLARVYHTVKLSVSSRIAMKFIFPIVLFLQFGFSTSLAFAANISVAWDAPTTNADGSPLNDLSHYRVKYGTSAGGPYPNAFTANTTSFTLQNLATGTYYAVATAVDINGNESTTSNELEISVGSGDLDGDGLSDSEEEALGTDPKKADTDGDGVKDGQEVTDGTNPLDSASHMPIHDVRICAPWNGFLVDSQNRPMWNVFEHVNASSTDLNIGSVVYTIAGNIADSFGFQLPSGTQKDVLIHDSPGREINSYGTACSTSDGQPGDLRGTMVYYKQSIVPTAFDFALAIAATTPRAGIQHLFNNTYQPSLAFSDAANAVAIWGQLISDSDTVETGRLLFWLQDGSLFSERSVLLQPKARLDIALHDIGANQVGTVEWVPDNLLAKFKFDAARYLYDNQVYANSFESAFLLPALVGSGELLGVPYSTIGASSVLEIANTTNAAVTATVKLYGQAGGAELLTQVIPLPAKGSYHLILDGLAVNQRGLATIQGDKANSVIAVAMQYQRRPDGSVRHLYGVSGVPAIGIELVGSYNTWISQLAEVWFLNLGDASETTSLTLTRSTGEQPVVGESVVVPAKGLTVLSLNDREQPDNYGRIKVQGSNPHKIVVWGFRSRSDEYTIPLQLTE